MTINGIAQEIVNSCPCENCSGLIEDNTGPVDYNLNIFNIQNNDLANADQCVSKVGVTFRHDYVGDITMELISPVGDIVQLIGDVTSSRGVNGQTNNRLFDITFISNSEVPEPDAGYENRWNNDQNWIGIGVLDGSYYPNEGDLEGFDTGRVNGTWTLRVTDWEPQDNDEGQLIDFYVEFCDDEGLVCDPCLDPEDDPICTFTVDPGEITVVPDEEFCLPIYVENVAFLEVMRFPLTWDETKLDFIRVDSFRAEYLNASHFDITNTNTGNLAFYYTHPDFDSLGLVVADSTPIFNICFKGNWWSRR